MSQPVSEDNTKLLDGFRALSITWVMIGHSYSTRITDIVNNPEDLPYAFGWASTAILGSGAFKAVDTFFWIGGFLKGYLILYLL